MVHIAAAAASSHAYALTPPERWEENRRLNREAFAKRWRVELPPESPLVQRETLEGNTVRYARLADGFAKVRRGIDAIKPDVCVIFGDDQHELFTDWVPQFAIYTGDELEIRSRPSGLRSTRRGDPELAQHLLKVSVEGGFDVTDIRRFVDNTLVSHAMAQIITFYELAMPVIPVFVNAVTDPSPNPARCFAFGQKIREALDSFAGQRVAVLYGSGGLSHFVSSYPFSAGVSLEKYGSIAEEFDRRFVSAAREGRGEDLAQLDSRELLEHGDIEARQWITIMGALGNVKADWVEYEAFYRGLMGMGVAYWQHDLGAAACA
jgi:OH-DDVA oxygenase/3-O-methylgallate 3,4-dioxygenase